jgi:2-keto-4-pentenoate hydratase/2-oxohepta-3-ene-1,7-dioic acid hydratase in catechol pathway
MQLVYFLNEDGAAKLGMLYEDAVFDIDALQAANSGTFFSNRRLHIADIAAIQKIYANNYTNTNYWRTASNLQFTSPVFPPSKIICIGLNYRQHAIESNMAIPTAPVVFSKFNNTLINYGAAISLGNVGEQFDYEVELGVVIGKEAKNVKKEEALDYVFGYCVANDLSCRDLQFRSTQWLLGKSLDGFLPLGKYILTADELVDPQQLNLKCWVNGELRQNSTTADMIFSVAEIITDLSNHMTLVPGDLILTGTPFGVVLGMQEKKWLKPNDIMKVEIEKLGFSENRLIP